MSIRRTNKRNPPPRQRDFVEWLNQVGPEPDVDGCVPSRDSEALLESVIRDSAEPIIEWLNDLSKNPPRRGRVSAGWIHHRRMVNQMVEHCLVYPQFSSPNPGGGLRVKWIPTKNVTDDQRRWISCTHAIVWMEERGLLSQLERCYLSTCRRWFIRKKTDQKFCSTGCGIAVREAEPSRRDK
jgi:hypothetical protein